MGKLNFCWAGNQGSYNGGNSFRRTSFVTRQTSGTYSKPRANCGEENFACGQDWGYMIGNYDGAQNNGSFKWYCSDNCKNMVRTSSVVVGSNE